MRVIVNFAVVFLIAVSIGLPSDAMAPAVPGQAEAEPKQLRIFYYPNSKHSRASFLNNPDSIDVIAPQTYSINAGGYLKGVMNGTILAFARENNIKMMPLVTNELFSRSAAHAFLDDPGARERAISAMAGEGIKHGYWGWQFDFEQVDVSYRDKYSQFIRDASQKLARHGLMTSVAVAAQISENPEDYPPNTWKNMVGVYDFKALGASADFLSIMSYDDPGSRGPVARYSWMEDVIKFSLLAVPARKISLGLPLYYWKWNETTDKLIDIGGYAGIQEVLKKYPVTFGYSPEEEAPFISYTVKKKDYTLWYENASSIAKKITLIDKYRLQGFSAWALGLELPDVHSALATFPGSPKNSTSRLLK